MALESYVPVVIFAIVSLLFPLGTFFATRLFRPDHPTPLKDLTYECGEVPEGEAQIQFHFQYYMFALIFVVFDVAAVFLLLWAFAWAGLLWWSRAVPCLPLKRRSSGGSRRRSARSCSTARSSGRGTWR